MPAFITNLFIFHFIFKQAHLKSKPINPVNMYSIFSPIFFNIRFLTTPVFTLFLLSSIWCGFSSCEKDPEVITNNVTIIDTLVLVDTLVLIDTVTVIDFQDFPDTVTTFILVRHAETTGSGSNPNLSAAGISRANELVRILGEVDLDAVYATNFNRTMQTAQPVATASGLSIISYDPFTPNTLIDNALVSFPDGVILVVGHSNTTASMLNALTGTSTYPDIAETEYDNLFIVHVLKRGEAKVTHLKYGM